MKLINTVDYLVHIVQIPYAGAFKPPVLNEQFNANLVPLRATSSESVPAMELYNMHKGKTKK